MTSKLAIFTTALLLSSAAAHADISISSKPTSNMSCNGGNCTASAPKAVLNVTDLETMLASGDVTVKTGGITNNIDIVQPLTWSSTSRLTLDAQLSAVVMKAVTVTGAGSMTIMTNDGGQGGEFYIQTSASIQFWNLNSSLVINGQSYKLVADLKSLASAIHQDSAASYALAKPYDASQDGRYRRSPIAIGFSGNFEGLGNPITNLTIKNRTDNGTAGLFSDANGSLSDVVVLNASVAAVGSPAVAGALAAEGIASIHHCFTSGKVFATTEAGGLVAVGGNISSSGSSARVQISTGEAGGLVGSSEGSIFSSYATGDVTAGDDSFTGGLIGVGEGLIGASYARGSVAAGANSHVGGLIGLKGQSAFASYSTGLVTGGSGSLVGGFAGSDSYFCCNSSDYWDIDSSGTDQGTGTGNESNLVGLTTAQFQTGLPEGFTPDVWSEKGKINSGYPYLLANPPPKRDQ